MKKLLCHFAITLGIAISAQTAAIAQTQTIDELEHGYYHSSTLQPGRQVYWKYEVPANTLGVFTLKNTSRNSNFDMYVYLPGSREEWNLVSEGNNPGTQTELLITDIDTDEKYYYIVIKNRGAQAAQFRLDADYVDPMSRFMAVALESGVSHILSGGGESPHAENWDRAVVGMSSLLQGSSLGGLGRDLVIREMTSEMRSQFGYNWFGDLMVKWAASMTTGIFRDYY